MKLPDQPGIGHVGPTSPGPKADVTGLTPGDPSRRSLAAVCEMFGLAAGAANCPDLATLAFGKIVTYQGARTYPNRPFASNNWQRPVEREP